MSPPLIYRYGCLIEIPLTGSQFPFPSASPWTIAKSSVTSSLSSILIWDVLSGNQTQWGILPYKWATLASFAVGVSIVSSTLYPPEMLHQVLPNRTLIIHTIFSGYHPGHRVVSAGGQITAKVFAQRTLQMHLVRTTSMHQGNGSLSLRRPQSFTLLFMSPDNDTQVTFSCSGKQGALLYLPFPAELEDAIATDDFEKWITGNISGCMRLAEEKGMKVKHMEDIILVTGRHLAKSWVRAVFSESRGGAQVSFVVKVLSGNSVRLEERNVSGAQLEFGPNGEVGFCIIIKDQNVLRNDIMHTSNYHWLKTNAYSFEVFTSSVS